LLDRLGAAERERDELAALLREASAHIRHGMWSMQREDLMAKIDTALAAKEQTR
jgi:uncharacterized protein YpiB (UPF0302 family)